jgi:hypothetical protein
MLALVAVILIVSAGPLTVFIRRMRRAKERGIIDYGTLANRIGGEFETKWLSAETQTSREMLEAPDFSATTDFYTVAANVYEMRDVPFSLKDLIGPVLPALVPFGIVALLSIPPQVVIQNLIKLLL